MALEEKLAEARQLVSELLTRGHIAQVEEVYDEHHQLIGVKIHHYPQCRQCVKERGAASGKERKI